MSDYRSSGVNIEEGYRAVDAIAADLRSTWSPGVIDLPGGFAGLLSLGSYRDPVLVTGTDGVGTKVELARAEGDLTTIGIDLVAMCVHDILCHGATPLLFLDYVAVDRLQAEELAAIVRGVAAGCREAGASLLGGETAEMPGVYRPDRFDLAGFALGVVERGSIIDGSRLAPGMVLLGLASSGVHSNGFSLVRSLFPELQEPGGDAALRARRRRYLEPTRIYASVLAAIREETDPAGIAHITGGGWYENMPRLLGRARGILGLRVYRDRLPRPPVFAEIAAAGVAEEEMYRIFNMGVGLVIALGRDDAERARTIAADRGVEAWRIGEVVPVADLDGAALVVE